MGGECHSHSPVTLIVAFPPITSSSSGKLSHFLSPPLLCCYVFRENYIPEPGLQLDQHQHQHQPITLTFLSPVILGRTPDEDGCDTTPTVPIWSAHQCWLPPANILNKYLKSNKFCFESFLSTSLEFEFQCLVCEAGRAGRAEPESLFRGEKTLGAPPRHLDCRWCEF